MNNDFSRIYKEFEKFGLLLLSDSELPSLVGLIAGPVKGSWWGHPKGNLIYNLSQQFEDDSEILTVKLVNKKVTYVHRKHWEALFSIVLDPSPWQQRDLEADHKRLLSLVRRAGSVRGDEVAGKNSSAEIRKQISFLEERLLIYSQGLHTESGKHIRLLKSWETLAKDLELPAITIKKLEAQDYFEKLFENWSSGSKKKVSIPWR